MKIVQTLNTISKAVAKNSPAIFTVVGIVGLGATSVFAYKSAKKVEVIVEKIEAERTKEEFVMSIEDTYLTKGVPITHAIKEDYEKAKAELKPFNRFEVVKDIAGAVALPVVLGLGSVTCIALSYHIQNNRILNLGAALATATAERAYYNNKFKKEYGEEAYSKFTTPVNHTSKTVTQADGTEKTFEDVQKEVIPSLHGEWFDKSSEYTKDDHNYNLAYISSINEKMDLRLFRKGSLLMNEVFDGLGLPRTRAGAVMGWTTGTGFNLYPETTWCFNEATGECDIPQIYIKWTQPKNIFNDIEFDSSKGL